MPPTLLRSSVGAVLALAAAAAVAHAQRAPVEKATPIPVAWSARWITPPGELPTGYGVYHFRRTFELGTKPRSFKVHVSADNRYHLFANGKLVARGPARGHLARWRYETVDLAPFLVAGKNALAAVVWNYAENAPNAQITYRTAFILHGDTVVEQKLVDTGSSWRVIRSAAYEPIPFTSSSMRTYYVVGPGDRIHGDKYPWGWQTAAFDDASWKAPMAIGQGTPQTSNVTDNQWLLVPRSIPLMEEKPERIAKVRRATGITAPAGFPSKPVPLKVPPRTKAELLLDQSHLTTAYPELVVSGGRGAKITLGYAENLYEAGGGKGHRDEIEGKTFRGNYDEFLPDGAPRRTFSTLWWRTYRYLRLTIETEDDPLTLDDLRALFTGYPFKRRARFAAGNAELDKILEVGWRTARLCAHETYIDCPYYEQLQYTADTRVQALVSLFMSGDDRLMRNAIEQFNDSRLTDQPTMSRFPAREGQYITTFSLIWIGMLHDYFWYRDDPEFVRQMLPGVRSVLAFFERHSRDDAGLRVLPYWNFVDWVAAWPGGVPPGWSPTPPWAGNRQQVRANDPNGAMAALDLYLLLAYDWAAALESAVGDTATAERHREEAARLRAAIEPRYFSPERGLFADTPARRDFSQHANVLSVIGGVVEGQRAADLVEKVLADGSLAPSSIYFRYYLHEALRRAGLAERYLEQLGPWRRMLARGLTTWSETEDPSRSECHAWGASPNVELFRTVLGIDSAAPGFAKVRLAPALGKLRQASGTIPHPRGDLGVSYKIEGGTLRAEVQLPAGVIGELVWRGQARPLRSGRSVVTVASGR